MLFCELLCEYTRPLDPPNRSAFLTATAQLMAFERTTLPTRVSRGS